MGYAVYTKRVVTELEVARDENFSDESVDRYQDRFNEIAIASRISLAQRQAAEVGPNMASGFA